jgi:very-long-chain enoyl-CoA reductase
LLIDSAPRQPIKRLPTSIEINEKTTVQDVKDQLAKQAGGWDPNRFGLFDPATKKILKDRKALVNQSKEVMAGKEILVKDLGIYLHSEFAASK